MSDIEKDMPEAETEEQIVIMTDEEGHEFYYREEMVIPVDNKNFAMLVAIDDACECEDDDCQCHSEEDEDPDVFIARVDFDEDGEPLYLDPTDEEFEAVKAAYEKMIAEE